MTALLKLSSIIDGISSVIGRIGDYLVLLCCLISAGNAIARYTFHGGSNAWSEIQWYLFAYVVMMGASYTLARTEHIRVDLIYGAVSERKRLWIDVIGTLFFLLPICAICAWLCWPFFKISFLTQEMSSDAGGLIRWPVKFMLFFGFVLLFVQGISEFIKRVAALMGLIQLETKYEKPLQ